MKQTFPTEMWSEFLQEVRQINNSSITAAGVIMRPMATEDLVFKNYIENFIKNGLNLNNIDYIFEFGAGHGRFFKLLVENGFKGKCVLFDFPEMHVLQRRFLTENKIDISRVEFLSDIECLPEPTPNNLFISMSAIEEAPWEIFEHFANYAKKYENFIFKYSGGAGVFEDIISNKPIKWVNLDDLMGRDFVYMRLGINENK